MALFWRVLGHARAQCVSTIKVFFILLFLRHQTKRFDHINSQTCLPQKNLSRPTSVNIQICYHFSYIYINIMFEGFGCLPAHSQLVHMIKHFIARGCSKGRFLICSPGFTTDQFLYLNSKIGFSLYIIAVVQSLHF